MTFCDPEYVLDQAESSPDHVRDMLVQLHEDGETVADILAFIQVLDQRKIRVQAPQNMPVFDICGTGGSGLPRINLSTALAIKLSDRFAIAKHGNKAASGRIGSFDVLEHLDYERGDTPEKVQQNLLQKNLAFVFAPAFHPALKALAPIRRSLPHPTIFNFLGPLLNPVGPLRAQMIGVSSREVGEKLAEVAQHLDKKALLVHDLVTTLDDVSLCGETQCWEVDGAHIRERIIVPEDYGLQRIDRFDLLKGGETAEENVQIVRNLLQGTAAKEQQDFLSINERVAIDFFTRWI